MTVSLEKKLVCIFVPSQAMATPATPSFSSSSSSPTATDWDYFPGMFAEKHTWDDVLKQIEPHCRKYTNKLYGKEYEARRISCVVGVSKYGALHTVGWDDIPLVRELRDHLTEHVLPGYAATDQTKRPVEKRFLYCLVHIYRDGTRMIGEHCDRECVSTPVASVSFAPPNVTRTFYFRPKTRKGEKKKPIAATYDLGHGDLLMMKAGCQRRFKHAVPEVKDMDQPRINMTFRFADPCGINDPTGTKQAGEAAAKAAPKASRKRKATSEKTLRLPRAQRVKTQLATVSVGVPLA
jgi:hypothetical protein